MRFAVLASGNGSNLQAIIRAVQRGTIKSQLALVISDRPKAFALKRALAAGITTSVIEPKPCKTPAAFDKVILQELKDFQIDFVVLAGYMRILSPVVVRAYKNKILNIHPALLPAFKGAHAIKDAFDHGVKVTGVTVHVVDEKVDNGPIIFQEPVNVYPSESFKSLEARIHNIEHKLYPQAIALFADKKIRIRGRRVTILKKSLR